MAVNFNGIYIFFRSIDLESSNLNSIFDQISPTEFTSKKNKNWRDGWKIRIYKENFKPKKEYSVNDFEARVCLKVDKFKYQKEYEYDISVNLPQENFIGGSGLLVFHNTPFLNLTLDIKPPKFLSKQPVIIGGKPQKEIYGEFQEEIDMLNKAFYEVIFVRKSHDEIEKVESTRRIN